MHGHGSNRVERVRPNIFWGESKSGRAHSLGIGLDYGNDVRGANRAETPSSRIVADWGGRSASMFSQAEEDVDACSDWAGCRGLRSETRDGLTSDGVLLVFQGEDDMGDVLERLY